MCPSAIITTLYNVNTGYEIFVPNFKELKQGKYKHFHAWRSRIKGDYSDYRWRYPAILVWEADYGQSWAR